MAGRKTDGRCMRPSLVLGQPVSVQNKSRGESKGNQKIANSLAGSSFHFPCLYGVVCCTDTEFVVSI